MLAAIQGHTDCMRLLLKHIPEVQVSEDPWVNAAQIDFHPLMCSQVHTQCKHPIQIVAIDDKCCTALHLAAGGWDALFFLTLIRPCLTQLMTCWLLWPFSICKGSAEFNTRAGWRNA